MRRITRQNFSDGASDTPGTTIDGNTIDRALDDMVGAINRIEVKDLERRWLPQKLVTGYQPLPAGGAPVSPPFLVSPNTNATALAAKPDPYANANRFKGIYITNENDLNYAWTYALAFADPIVIVEATAMLMTTTAAVTPYANSMQYSGPPTPAHKVAGDSVDDFHVIVSVDDPYRPEDRSRNAVVVGRHRVEARAEPFTPLTPNPGWPDLNPTWAAGSGLFGHITGVTVRLVDLNIPVHRNGRVRFGIIVPHWTGDMAPWGATPWATCYYALDLTYLEEVKG